MQKILIVPDTLLEEELGPSLLDRDTLCVRCARSGEEALQIAAAWRPGVVVFGARLADMSAAQLAATLRRAGDIRLLFLHDALDELGGDAPIEVDAQLVAPVEPAFLLGTLAELLRLGLRRAPRVGVRILARFEELSTSAGAPGMCTVLSLSEVGLLLEAPRELDIGATLRIALFLPGSTRHLVLPSKIEAVMDEMLLRYGASFDALDDVDRSALRAYVEARGAQGGPEAAGTTASFDGEDDAGH